MRDLLASPQFAHQLEEQVLVPEDPGVDSGSFCGLIAKMSGSVQMDLIANHALDKLGSGLPAV